MNAAHFRQRAARAREMAQFGDDIHLSRMLLDLAIDLDAEAAAIEAGDIQDRRSFLRISGSKLYGALLHLVGSSTGARPVEIINLSTGGARFLIDRLQTPGSKVILELPSHALRLDGTILRVRGAESAMVFNPSSSADPTLSRLLRSKVQTDRIQA